MLDELCAEIRNYFIVPNGIHTGTFTISGGKLAPSEFLQENQYFRIIGSVFNDGIYKSGADIVDPTTNTAHDETFVGAVWAMAVPPAVVALADEIKAYVNSKYAKPSPYISESFNGYSYTKATNADGSFVSWQKVFAHKLNRYRRYSVL